MSFIGAQNLCRVHYVLFYAIAASLVFDFGLDRDHILNTLVKGVGGNADTEISCPLKSLLGILFFTLANAFAAAAQTGPKGPRKIIQYAAFPLYLAVLYTNVNTFKTMSFSIESFTENCALVTTTFLFLLSTHTLYIAGK
eukprot:CAMPEP_0195520432 /NCGR_PEP_ID=MMETSP0794_2-20130614/16857_1 /TAXON_ID=515487 /ORGANISM="Stephanopyxis turris, Strain CCMP 815" /LENGTH=139 /DNA_ID=CAMNT_0040649783 /DNA_START=62 /DNA_END=481 /DNA_ORIENTATION=+